MREMKVSGNPWIKNIPQDWEIIRCKYISSFINGFAFDSKKLELNDYKYPVIRIGDIKDGNVDFYGCQGVNENLGLNSYQIKKDDILLAMSGATVGKVGLVRDDKEAYINQRVGIIRTQNPRYLYYCLSSKEFIEYINLISDGSAQPNVSGDGYGNYEIALPTLKEQEVIAAFLDKKCSEIDALTNDIEKEIEVLENYKKSVITEAVTRGLNPNVEMKDSGIKWIGNCPNNWDIIKIKNCSLLKGRIGWQGLQTYEYLDDETLPYLITGTDFDNGKINWNTCAHVSEERFKIDQAIQIKENDLLITKDGTIGKLALTVNCPNKVCLNSGVLLIRNTKNYKYDKKYLYYILSSNQFYLWYESANAGNSTIRHLNQEKFYNFVFTYPSIDEQEDISKYLDEKCDGIDKTISDKQKQLDVLAEYKKSLIYEYVTGKKEVPTNA